MEINKIIRDSITKVISVICSIPFIILLIPLAILALTPVFILALIDYVKYRIELIRGEV